MTRDEALANARALFPLNSEQSTRRIAAALMTAYADGMDAAEPLHGDGAAQRPERIRAEAAKLAGGEANAVKGDG